MSPPASTDALTAAEQRWLDSYTRTADGRGLCVKWFIGQREIDTDAIEVVGIVGIVASTQPSRLWTLRFPGIFGGEPTFTDAELGQSTISHQ